MEITEAARNKGVWSVNLIKQAKCPTTLKKLNLKNKEISINFQIKNSFRNLKLKNRFSEIEHN